MKKKVLDLRSKKSLFSQARRSFDFLGWAVIASLLSFSVNTAVVAGAVTNNISQEVFGSAPPCDGVEDVFITLPSVEVSELRPSFIKEYDIEITTSAFGADVDTENCDYSFSSDIDAAAGMVSMIEFSYPQVLSTKTYNASLIITYARETLEALQVSSGPTPLSFTITVTSTPK